MLTPCISCLTVTLSSSVFLSLCLLSLCLTVTLSYCHSVLLSLCLPVTLSSCHSVFLSLCLPLTLSPCHSVLLSPLLLISLVLFALCSIKWLTIPLDLFLSFLWILNYFWHEMVFSSWNSDKWFRLWFDCIQLSRYKGTISLMNYQPELNLSSQASLSY